MRPIFDRIDRLLVDWMLRWGHLLHRDALGVYFVWLGALKVFGYKSATTLIAHVVYLGPPEIVVTALGVWEVAIGACLLYRPAVRVALLLLAVRLPGTVLALIVKSDVCFVTIPLVPTIEGQYLIKDVILFAAAMVIGGTIRDQRGRERASVVQLD